MISQAFPKGIIELSVHYANMNNFFSLLTY